MNKRIAGISIPLVCILLIVALILVRDKWDFARQFFSYSVTINNQSDYDISTFEVGALKRNDDTGEVEKSESKVIYKKGIEKGQKATVRPDITLSGKEGAIYLEYIDSNGNEVQKTICSYSESVTGYSNVTITKDRLLVTEKCQ